MVVLWNTIIFKILLPHFRELLLSDCLCTTMNEHVLICNLLFFSLFKIILL